MEIEFNQQNFEQEVMQSKIPVLVDFWAPWCGPCRQMAPIISELANEMADVKIGKLNVDENSEIAGQFSVMSIPMFLIFKNGVVVDQMLGAVTKDVLRAKLSQYI